MVRRGQQWPTLAFTGGGWVTFDIPNVIFWWTAGAVLPHSNPRGYSCNSRGYSWNPIGYSWNPIGYSWNPHGHTRKLLSTNDPNYPTAIRAHTHENPKVTRVFTWNHRNPNRITSCSPNDTLGDTWNTQETVVIHYVSYVFQWFLVYPNGCAIWIPL